MYTQRRARYVYGDKPNFKTDSNQSKRHKQPEDQGIRAVQMSF